MTNVSVTGLSKYTSYTVYVQAETVALGDRSETVTVFTDEDCKCTCTYLYVLHSEAEMGYVHVHVHTRICMSCKMQWKHLL